MSVILSITTLASCNRGKFNNQATLCDKMQSQTGKVDTVKQKEAVEHFKIGAKLCHDASYEGEQWKRLEGLDNAIKELQKAVSLDPCLADAHHWLGVANFLLGNDKQALASLTQAILLDPQFGEAYFFRAMANWHLDDYAGSLQDFTSAINRNATGLGMYAWPTGHYSTPVRPGMSCPRAAIFAWRGQMQIDFRHESEGKGDIATAVKLFSENGISWTPRE